MSENELEWRPKRVSRWVGGFGTVMGTIVLAYICYIWLHFAKQSRVRTHLGSAPTEIRILIDPKPNFYSGAVHIQEKV